MFFVLDRDKGPFKFPTACDDSSSQQKLRLPNRQSTTETPLHPKKKKTFAKVSVFNILYTDPCYLFFLLPCLPSHSIYFPIFPSFTNVDNLSVVPVFQLNLANSPVSLTSLKPLSVSGNAAEECTQIQLSSWIFLIFLFSTLTESVTTRPASASLQLGEHLKEEQRTTVWSPCILKSHQCNSSLVLFLQPLLQSVSENWKFPPVGIKYVQQ